MKIQRNFTRTDIIAVVICSIFILAAAGSIGTTGRRRAKEMVCACNLKKWGKIWKFYTDSHDSNFPQRGGDDIWKGTVGWPWLIKEYMPPLSIKLLFCPEATTLFSEGGQPPFVAWTAYDWSEENEISSSYCINLWVSAPYPDDSEWEKFWRTPYVRQAAFVPLMSDGNWKDAEPEPYDMPPEYENYWWQPNENEMKRVCVNRHNGGVNILFMDLSVRKTGLKSLWRLPWYRQWDMEAPLPDWPEWMDNFKEP